MVITKLNSFPKIWSYYIGRNKCQQAVKVEVTFTAAASPTGPLRSYRYLSIWNTNYWSIIFNSLCYQMSSFLPELTDFLFRKLARFYRVTGRKVFLDPSGFAFYKSFDIIGTHSSRAPDNDITFRHNLNCNGLPIALYSFVCNSIRHSYLISH